MAGIESTNASLKFRVRPTTRARFDSFKAELSVALGGARLTDSNLGRALADWFLFQAGDEVIAAAESRGESLRRPAADNPVAMAAFDEVLREVFTQGVLHWAASSRRIPSRPK